MLTGLEKNLSGHLGQIDFPARQQLFLLTCPLGKAPDKPHVNRIPKGKLDFRFFCNPDCRLATHPGELAIPNEIEMERNTCINNLFCFSDP